MWNVIVCEMYTYMWNVSLWLHKNYDYTHFLIINKKILFLSEMYNVLFLGEM